jgi:hypothetical protein
MVVLSHGSFVSGRFVPPDVVYECYVAGCFSLDVLSLRTFCPSGCFVPGRFVSQTFYPIGHFVPPDVLSQDVLTPDVLYGYHLSRDLRFFCQIFCRKFCWKKYFNPVCLVIKYTSPANFSKKMVKTFSGLLWVKEISNLKMLIGQYCID